MQVATNPDQLRRLIGQMTSGGFQWINGERRVFSSLLEALMVSCNIKELFPPDYHAHPTVDSETGFATFSFQIGSSAPLGDDQLTDVVKVMSDRLDWAARLQKLQAPEQGFAHVSVARV